MIFIRRIGLKNTRQHRILNETSIGIIRSILWSVEVVQLCNDALQCRLLRFCLYLTQRIFMDKELTVL